MPMQSANQSPSQASLKLKRVSIDTNYENVVYLHRDCSIYRAEGFQALAKIEIFTGERKIQATLNVVEDANIVAENEIGLSMDAFASLGADEGAETFVRQADRPESVGALFKKINGERLTKTEYRHIVADIAALHYSKIELTAFLLATNNGEMDREEIYYLTDAMVSSGRRLNWHAHTVVDKHCIGGIPGNRTSMLVVPIVAAHGMLCPKTSSRAITSPAGTADTMEVIAKVELEEAKLLDVVQQHHACLARGGTANLSPADDVMISVERPLSLDSTSQMVASILSKKIAAGSTHLVLDIPIGPTAKVRSVPEAQRLRKLFEYVASRMSLTLEVIITDGRQPIGDGIGPVLEARDVMRVLENDPRAPEDLRHKALRLAGRMIEFDPDVRGGDGFAIARDILESGRALEKMNAIIDAQGRKPFDANQIQLARYVYDVKAEKDGCVVEIDNLHIARVARVAGAPKVPTAGVDIACKLGAQVQAGDVLYRVYAEHHSDLIFAIQMCQKSSGYTLGAASDLSHAYVEF